MIRRIGVSTAFFLFSFINQMSANSPQVMYPASFLNPAAMQQIKESKMTSGIFVPNVHFKFHGDVLGKNGSIKSNNTLFFPYFTGSHRVADRVMIGVDVSNPILGYVTWPITGFQRALNVCTIVETYEVTPKISFSLTKKFAIGGSFRYLNVYRGQLDYTVLGSLVTNNATGQAIGGTVGIWWMINPKAIFDLCYFTPVKTTLKGTSTSGPFISNKLRTNEFTFNPGTFVANFQYIFGPQWMIVAKFAYSCWSVNKRLVLNNVAIGPKPTVLNLNLHDTVLVALRARYQPFSRVAFNAMGLFDQAWTDAKHNSLTLPFGNLWGGGLGVDFRFSNAAWIKFFAGYAQSTTPKINNPPQFVNGTNKAMYTWGDISGTVDF